MTVVYHYDRFSSSFTTHFDSVEEAVMQAACDMDATSAYAVCIMDDDGKMLLDERALWDRVQAIWNDWNRAGE